jgi:aspartate aminotransferase-like enzyme
MPTDALRTFHHAMMETKAIGFDKLKAAQWEQGRAVRAMLGQRGVKSVAADGFQAPAWWSATPTIPRSRTARSSPPKACRSPPACR